MKDVIPNTIFNIYLLYPIDRDDEGNLYRMLDTYTNVGIELQAYLLDWEKMDYISAEMPFPKNYLYVPSDHEAFIHRAYKDRLLTKEEIRFINCKIIKSCDLLIIFGENGVQINHNIVEEVQYAKQEKIPIYSMPDLSPLALDALKLAITFIIKARD